LLLFLSDDPGGDESLSSLYRIFFYRGNIFSLNTDGFSVDEQKDNAGRFECGYSQSNHRKSCQLDFAQMRKTAVFN
jgi:hypothetical protein